MPGRRHIHPLGDGDQRQLIDGLLPIDKPRLVAAGASRIGIRHCTLASECERIACELLKVAKPRGIGGRQPKGLKSH